MDRGELGALRDAIDTILTWPNPVRYQIAQWLQTGISKPSGADPGRGLALVLTGPLAPSRASEKRRGASRLY